VRKIVWLSHIFFLLSKDKGIAMIGLSMNQTNHTEENLFHPVDVDAWQEMYHIRKRYANLHPGGLSSADDLLTTAFYPYIRNYQILVAKKPESVKNQLRLLRDGFVQLTGYNDFPRPYICVQYINFHVLSDMINQVKDRFTHGKPEMFVLWYDITDGMMEILSGLKGALEDIGTFEGEMELLKNDPSGFTLIDTSVTELKSQVNGRPISKGVHIEEHQIPAFVLTGAHMAQTFYKILYPLTENL
jgi:hypothetical protein